MTKLRRVSEMKNPPRPGSKWWGGVELCDFEKSRATPSACGIAQNVRRVNTRINDPNVGDPEMTFLFHDDKGLVHRVSAALDTSALLGEEQHDAAKAADDTPEPFEYAFVVTKCNERRVMGPRGPRPGKRPKPGKKKQPSCRRRFTRMSVAFKRANGT